MLFWGESAIELGSSRCDLLDDLLKTLRLFDFAVLYDCANARRVCHRFSHQ